MKMIWKMKFKFYMLNRNMFFSFLKYAYLSKIKHIHIFFPTAKFLFSFFI